MTTISRELAQAPRLPAGGATSPAPSPSPDPNELVGKGSTSARWLGGIAGTAVGVGASLGVAALAGRVPLAPVRYMGAALTIAAPFAGGYLGQRAMGQLTRETRAEADRAKIARREDLQLQIRTLQAESAGQLDAKQKSRVDTLRKDRIKLVESRPEANFVGKAVLPAVLGIGLMVGSGAIAGKLTPDDGKGITAMFNAMFAGGAGGVAGVWAGVEAGRILTKGPHLAQLPIDTKERIAAIDRELDALLAAAGP
jgi:hypothetical protein